MAVPRTGTGAPLAPSDVDDVLALVRRQGGRATVARREVISVLLEGRGEHLTAEDVATAVASRLPEVHLSTVYRTLDALEELGVVSHVHLGHGPSTYHVAGERPHHHAVCSSCGAVVELDPDVLDGVADRVKVATGFEVDEHHFALTGRCTRCR